MRSTKTLLRLHRGTSWFESSLGTCQKVRFLTVRFIWIINVHMSSIIHHVPTHICHYIKRKLHVTAQVIIVSRIKPTGYTCESLFDPQLSFIWFLGKAVLLDCSIFRVSSLILFSVQAFQQGRLILWLSDRAPVCQDPSERRFFF